MKTTTQKPFILTYQENDYDVYVSLNYNYASSVQITSTQSDYWVGWSQFENCIYFGQYQNDEEVIQSIQLTETDLLVPNLQELKQKINSLPIPSEFPFEWLFEHVQQISDYLNKNHKQYWQEQKLRWPQQ